MKHLLLVAALAIGFQPVLTDVGRPNGATALAVVLVFVWGCLAARDAARHNS